MPAVNVSAVTSTEIVPENYNRTLLALTNSDSSANLHITFGTTASTDDAFIPPLGNMTISGDTRCRCAINGISSSGTIVAKYSQLAMGS